MFGVLKKTAAGLRAVLQRLFEACPDPPALPGETGRGEFLIVGHRGSPGRRPENTIPSFELAVRTGANAVEADLCMTADGHVVVWHDWDPDTPLALLRQRGWEPHVKYRPLVPRNGPYRQRVSKLTLEELRAHHGYRGKRGFVRKARARIPDLHELLEWAAGKEGLRFLHLDIKTPPDEASLAPRMALAIEEALEARRPGCEVVLNTCHETVFQGLRSGAPGLDCSLDVEIPFGLITEPDDYRSVPKAISLGDRVACVGRPTALTLAPWSTFTGIIVSDIVLRAAHNARPGTKRVDHLLAWTINHPREMACLIRLGVTGIHTDKPWRLRAVARRLGRVPAHGG